MACSLRDRIECHPDHRHRSAAHDLVRLRHRAQDHDLCHHFVFSDRYQYDARAQIRRPSHHRVHALDQRDRSEILFKVQLPSALPFIFASFKIAASLALVGAVVAEFYSSDLGLGYLIITSATQLRTDLLFVAIAVLAALGVGSFTLFGYLERKATRGERIEEMQ